MAETPIAPPISTDWVPLVGDRGYFFLLDLWRRSGGEVDLINTGFIQELYPWTFNYTNTGVGSPNHSIAVVSADYTIAGPMTVIVQASCTITLDPYPADSQTATIKRDTSAGNVILSGTIDGDSSYTMLANHEAIDLIYSVDSGEWSII
jgi:hypothetical protein